MSSNDKQFDLGFHLLMDRSEHSMHTIEMIHRIHYDRCSLLGWRNPVTGSVRQNLSRVNVSDVRISNNEMRPARHGKS